MPPIQLHCVESDAPPHWGIFSKNITMGLCTMKFIQQYRLFLLLWLLVALLLLTVRSAAAQSPASGPTDPAELEAFLDGLMTAQMKTHHVAGAVVAVVKDGNLLFSKGYGYADLEQSVPVDPARTLFRLGSVSKLFVWTAVMQQVEQGNLELDRDINDYLDFTIPNSYPEPITLNHLLTHTPGFEDMGQDLFKLDFTEMRPLDEYLKTHIPARVFAPGTIGAYSNYGTALAGYIVARVSGLPFDEYVEQNIFTPLEMEHSTFRQPLPENLAPDMSTGYNFVSGGYLEGGFEYVQAYPAGSLSAAANDLTRFMIAHLQNGTYGANRILEEATTQQMHQQLFTHDPRIDGMAHGFFENTVNDLRIISHGGDTILFHTGLFLIPEQNVGLFISTNSTGGAAVYEDVMRAFVDHYYPVEVAAALQPPSDFIERITPYLGSYTMARSNQTTYEKVLALTTPINASLNEAGYFVFSFAGEVTQYVEVEPGLLQDRYEPANQMVYRMNEAGQIVLLPAAPFAFVKTPWYGSVGLHNLLLIGGLLLFPGTIISWWAALITTWRKHEPQPLIGRLARLVATLFGLCFVVFVVGFMGLLLDMDPAYGVPNVFFTTPPLLNILLILPILMLITALTMPIFVLLVWKNGVWQGRGRVHYTLLTIVALALVWVMVYWNFLL